MRIGARLKGRNKESVNVDTYTDGVVSSHLSNVKEHIKAGGLSDWGKKKYPGVSSTLTSNL